MDFLYQKEMSKKKYLLVYTVVFALFCLGAFMMFLVKGKGFVWNQDGAPQYLPYLAYMGSYLREFLSRAIHGDFTIKMFDFTIGFGDDVGAVIRAHPLDFLSVFVPVRYTEVLYNVIVLLRLYLAGLFFSGFCALFKKLSVTVLTGSMIYVFCGYMMIYGLRHPTFLSAFIMFPLLLWSAERMMRKRGFGGFGFFSLTVFIGFMSNYYFMYMSTIGMLVFILLRFPVHYKEQRVKSFIILFFRMGGAFLLGAGMSMATLLPIIGSLASSARLAEQSIPDNLLFYDPRRYYRWYVELIEPFRGISDGTYLGYAAPVLPALVLTFMAEKKKHLLTLKLGLIIGFLVMMVPFGGYAMAGFSSVNNRWMFIFSMMVGLSFVFCGEEIFTCGLKKMIIVYGFAGLYLGLAMFDYLNRGNVYALFGMGTLLFTMVLILILKAVQMGMVSADGRGEQFFQSLTRWGMLLTVFVCITVNGFVCCSDQFGNIIVDYLDQGTCLTQIQNSEFANICSIEDDSFWRVDSNLVTSNKENYSLTLGYNSSSMYNSVLNGAVSYGLLSTGNMGMTAIHRFQSLDSRPAAEALANEKYYFTTADGDQHAPYGYVRRPEYSTAGNAIFENTMPVSFGYTYDTIISRSDYDALSEAEREQVMMEAVVIEEKDENRLEESGAKDALAQIRAGSDEILTVPCALPRKGRGVKKKDYGYKVNKTSGSIAFPYTKKAGYTCYLHLIGFTQSKGYAFLDVMTSDLRSLVLMRGEDKLYSINRENYLVNLGYDEKDREDQVEIFFYDKGQYKLSGIEMIYVPMDHFEERVEKLNDGALCDVSFDINTVSGRSSAGSAQMMVFSIPYSKGWTATVDGVSQPLMCANVSYLGLYLEPGEHEIVLKYAAPGGHTGRLAALACWILFGVLIVVSGRRRLDKNEVK